MDFLVEVEITIPPDHDETALADLLGRERSRAAELAEGDLFKRVWIVPGKPARIMICSATNSRELDETINTLPAVRWSRFKVTPVIERQLGSSICVSG